MNKILILFAHPALEKSRVHAALLEATKDIKGVTVNDLYELYPDFNIDVKKEQQLLLDHDIIVWQHPLYWYSAPAMLKQWQDLVLEHGWAYGRTGKALQGKTIFNAFSSGGAMKAYQRTGYQKCTIDELMQPFERTANLCYMNYWPPFWVPGSHLIEAAQIREHAQQYKELLEILRDGYYHEEELQQADYLNDIVSLYKKEK